MNKLKPMQVVIINEKYYERDCLPFKLGQLLLYLGEISNMEGHCAVVDMNGTIHWAYHIEHFRTPTNDEM